MEPQHRTAAELLAELWPAAVFGVAMVAAVDPDPARAKPLAFAIALSFGLWALHMALNLVIANLFPLWVGVTGAAVLIAVVYAQLWLALPGIDHIATLTSHGSVDVGHLVLAVTLLPIATAYSVKLLWHAGVARVIGDLGQGRFESWAAQHARVARWYGADGRQRIHSHHRRRAAQWRLFAGGAGLVVGYAILAGLWAGAAQLLVAALLFSVPWLVLRVVAERRAPAEP